MSTEGQAGTFPSHFIEKIHFDSDQIDFFVLVLASEPKKKKINYPYGSISRLASQILFEISVDLMLSYYGDEAVKSARETFLLTFLFAKFKSFQIQSIKSKPHYRGLNVNIH